MAGDVTMSTGVDVCFLGFLLLPTSLFSELTEVMIAATLLAQHNTILLLSKLTLGLSGILELAGPDCLDLFENTLHDTFLDFVEKAAFNLSSKQQSREYWSRQSKAPMDKFGTAMRSRYVIFRKTIQESLDAESSDGNHSWPGNATSSDSLRFCIA